MKTGRGHAPPRLRVFATGHPGRAYTLATPTRADLLELRAGASAKIEHGTRAVLKNPWLLFGLMGASLLARLLFAAPNKEKSR
jgi:hypothetical protein